MIIRFFKTIFGIYAALVFIVVMLLTLPGYFLVFWLAPKKKAPHWAHRYISYNWAATLFICYLIRWKVKNVDYLDRHENYVFVANHSSALDIPAYALSCKNTFRFLSKAELAKLPVLGFIIRNLYITVDRSNKSDRAKSMEAMLKSLNDGVSIFLCPEGTRNRTTELLLPFRDGAFRTAIEAQVPIAVLTVKNANKLLNTNRPLELRPGKVELIWSKPLSTKGMTMDDVEKLKATAREQMLSNL